MKQYWHVLMPPLKAAVWIYTERRLYRKQYWHALMPLLRLPYGHILRGVYIGNNIGMY
jgi:hypothetical protein